MARLLARATVTARADRATSGLIVICALIMILALADLAIRAAVRLATRWDTFMYHVPFAALRGGLPIPYDMNDTMRPYYEGFPPLPHLLQGILWRLTGSVNATGVVNYMAFIAFLIYCHTALRARFWLVAMISLTAPMVLIHTTVSYVDLFGNCLLAMGISSCLYLHLSPQPSRLVTLCGLGGLIGAAWSKYQLTPVVALAWCLFAVVSLSPSRKARFSRRQAVALLSAAALLAALPYLKNLALYGNPFWPLRVPFMTNVFPYEVDGIAVSAASQRPPPIREYGQFRLFVHSLFEIDHPVRYAHRPRWTIDQGNAWIAFRMGGFWATGVITYLLATIGLLVVHKRKAGILTGLVFVATLCFVALLPQSHELRYLPIHSAMLGMRDRHAVPGVQEEIAPGRAGIPGDRCLPFLLHGLRESRPLSDLEGGLCRCRTAVGGISMVEQVRTWKDVLRRRHEAHRDPPDWADDVGILDHRQEQRGAMSRRVHGRD